MGSIQLGPKDCERYGVPPEGVPFDLNMVGVRQRAALLRETKRSWNWLIDRLGGVPELDEYGNAIPVPVIDPATGEQKIENGEPAFKPKLIEDGDAIAMVVWLALWGAGIKVPWEGFEVLPNGLVLDFSDGDEAPGKAGEAATDSGSTTSDPS